MNLSCNLDNILISNTIHDHVTMYFTNQKILFTQTTAAHTPPSLPVLFL